MDDFYIDSSSQSSLGGEILPPWRQTKMGGTLRARPLTSSGSVKAKGRGKPFKNVTEDIPARGSMRSSSTKSKGTGKSFRGSLKNVTEDKEVDMDEEADDPEQGQSVKISPRRQRKTLPAKPCWAPSLLETDNHKSLPSSWSVDVMDFGVDPDGRLFAESALSLSVSSSNYTASPKGSLSNLVDSQGFMAWDNDSTSDSTSVGSSHAGHCPTSGRCSLKRSNSWTSSASWSSNLADSLYLGWDSQRPLVDCPKDLTATAADRARTIEGSDGEKKDVSVEEDEETLDAHEISQGVEDDRDSNGDVVDPSSPIGCKNGLSKRIKQFSTKVTGGIAAKRNIPTEIPTDIRRILFASRSESEPLPNNNKTKDDSGLWSLFGNASWNASSDTSQTLSIDDEYYSRGSIRINREDDIDIGELRRELLVAAAEGTEDNNSSKSKLKMGFL